MGYNEALAYTGPYANTVSLDKGASYAEAVDQAKASLTKTIVKDGQPVAVVPDHEANAAIDKLAAALPLIKEVALNPTVQAKLAEEGMAFAPDWNIVPETQQTNFEPDQEPAENTDWVKHIHQVTGAELDDLKIQINYSFEEVANALLDVQQQLQTLFERIEVYNRRSSHKI